jgi:hypothetical protein
MRWAWLVALALPMWPALIPTDFFYKEEFKTEDDLNGLFIRAGDAAAYAIQLMPLILSIPNGVIKGSLRIRGLLPMSPMAGWVIVITAPFLALLMFAALMMLLQVAGDWLLVVAATLLTFSPVLYIAFKKLYAAATTEEDEIKLDKIQWGISWIQLLGLLLALIWAFTYTTTYDGIQFRIIGVVSSDPNHITLLPLTSGVRLFFESLGRSFVASLVVADAVLRMTLVTWRTGEINRRSQEGKGNEECLGELYRLLLPVVDAEKDGDDDMVDDAIKLEHEEDDEHSIGFGVNLEGGEGEPCDTSTPSTPMEYIDHECSSLDVSSSNY